MAGLGVFLARSRYGIAIRAVAQDIDAARLQGVPIRRLYPDRHGLRLGARRHRRRLPRPPSTSPPADRGDLPLLIALIVVVFGGLGSLPGAIVRRVRHRLHPGDGVDARRDDLVAADPLRGDPARPRRPPAGLARAPDGGAAVSAPADPVRATFTPVKVVIRRRCSSSPCSCRSSTRARTGPRDGHDGHPRRAQRELELPARLRRRVELRSARHLRRWAATAAAC